MIYPWQEHYQERVTRRSTDKTEVSNLTVLVYTEKQWAEKV